MLIRIKELINLKANFAFETTLSARYYVILIKEAHE
jgi:predicted ABC-type ATPase